MVSTKRIIMLGLLVLAAAAVLFMVSCAPDEGAIAGQATDLGTRDTTVRSCTENAGGSSITVVTGGRISRTTGTLTGTKTSTQLDACRRSTFYDYSCTSGTSQWLHRVRCDSSEFCVNDPLQPCVARCTDSDPSNDLAVRGIVTITQTGVATSDSCLAASTSVPTGRVQQVDCQNGRLRRVSTEACPSGTRCSDGACVLLCGNGVVDAGETCSSCAADVVCAAGQVCQEGACVLLCGNGVMDTGETCSSCAVDVVCASGQVCQGGACVVVEIPTTPTIPTIVAPTIVIECPASPRVEVIPSGTSSVLVEVNHVPVLEAPASANLGRVAITTGVTATGGTAVVVTGLEGVEHFVYVPNTRNNGVFTCPLGTTIAETVPSCDGVITYSYSDCSAGTGWCSIVGSQYRVRSSGSSHGEGPAETICDDLDNNGNGVIDEGCDTDHDDYCDSTMTTVGTPAVCPHGGGDCDDSRSQRNPGPSVVEICNNFDDNCDGRVDANADGLIYGICQSTCTETDGGDDPLVGGFITWQFFNDAGAVVMYYIEKDYCLDDTDFIESHCTPYWQGMAYTSSHSTCARYGLTSRCIDPDGPGRNGLMNPSGTPDSGNVHGYCTNTCGNGMVELGELCDDGNTINGDSCTRCRCSDTDGGRSPIRRGTVTTADGTFRDVCSTEIGHEVGHITERFCADDGSLQSEDLGCNYGMASDDPYRNEFGTSCETASSAAGCVIVG